MKKAVTYSALIIVFALTAMACSKRIPHEKMTDLLADLYLYANLPDELGWPQRDSVSLRLSLFEKYRVSEEQFDKTMQYYAEHPKKMRDLYEDIDSLTKKRAGGYKQALEDFEMAQNLWLGNQTFKIDSVQNPEVIAFHIPVDSAGNYTLKISATLFDDDSTQQPQMVGYFLTGIKKHSRDTINRKTIDFTKFETPQDYALNFSIKDTAINAFEGYWLSTKADTAKRRQHVTLEKLRILYNNDPKKTIVSDTLRPTVTTGKNKKETKKEKAKETPVTTKQFKYKPNSTLKTGDKATFKFQERKNRTRIKT